MKHAKTPRLTLFIKGTPKPQGSKTVGTARSGRMFMREAVRGLKEWRRQCESELTAWRLTQKTFATIDEPVEMVATFYLRIPKSKSRTLSAMMPHSVKPDLSKLVRAIEDAMTSAGIVVDDALICQINAKKVYGYAEGVEVELYDCI